MRTKNTAEEKRIENTITRIARTITIIFIVLASVASTANVDLITPEDNLTTNERNNTFEYFVNNLNATTCSLKVDGEIANTNHNITEGFWQLNATINLDKHTWQVVCSDGNNTEESEIRNITIDQAVPTIVLLNPQSGQAIFTNSVNLSFVALDNHAETIPCTLYINNESIEDITAPNTIPQNRQLTNLSNGEYIWKYECRDDANNTKVSEERTFTINQTQPIEEAPNFALTLARREFSTGEAASFNILSPTGSNMRVEVCPDKSGFVECIVPLNIQNSTSTPLTGSLPFMNYEGKYIVDAYFTYKNNTATKTERYNTTSQITISAESTDRPRKNEIIFLEANSAGGLGDINYTWHLSNGNKINSRKANITYTSPGNYTNTIFVKDEYNNTRNKSITIEVSNSNKIIFNIRDSVSNSPIKEAMLDIDYQDKETDANGVVELFIRTGRRELIIMAKNYSIYQQEINITKDETITILLNPLNMTKPKPEITLTNPLNNTTIIGNKTEVGFKVSHKYESNCSIYISEESNGFYIYLGSTRIAPNDQTEKRFEIIDLENKKYTWKVECIDNQQMTSTSETRTINVGYNKPQESNDEINKINNNIKQLELALTDVNNAPIELKESLEALNYHKSIESSIREMKNTVRDLDSLNFNNLDQKTISSRKQELITKSEEIYKNTPLQFEMLSSDSFVDYIEKPDLEALAKEYVKIKLGENNTLSMNKILKRLEAFQQEVLISTKTRSIKVTNTDGNSKEITLILRDLKVYNITAGSTLVESIPKSAISSASLIKSPAKFETIKEDTIISFPIIKDTTLVYYVESKISPELVREIKTAIFFDLTQPKPEYVTGFSIKEIKIDFKGKGLIMPIILVVLLTILIFGVVRYEGDKIARYAVYAMRKKDTLHYINVVLNDIKDNLQVGNIHRAADLYEEAKVVYSELPLLAKNDVYEEILSVAKSIQEYQDNLMKNNKMQDINILLSNAESMLSAMQLTEAIQEYKRIESAYHELDESTMEKIHPHIVDLGNKIQIMIESNRKQKYE